MNTLKGSPKSKDKKETADIFSLDDISGLLKVLKDNEVTEFKLERANERISLKRGDAKQETQYISAPVVQQQPYQVAPAVPPAAAAPAPAPEAAPAPAASANGEAAVSNSNVEEITSPMVGTFYARPSPDADAYVNVGDVVKKGDKLCIIEAMKIMNEIEAEKSGKVVSVCLDDGQMVEYGETLFKVEPI